MYIGVYGHGVCAVHCIQSLDLYILVHAPPHALPTPVIRKHGKSYEALANALEGKTIAQCRNFFTNYKRKLNLPRLIAEYEIRHVSFGTSVCGMGEWRYGKMVDKRFEGLE